MKKRLIGGSCFVLSVFLVLLLCAGAGFVSAAGGYSEPEVWKLNGVNAECRTGQLVAYTGDGKTGTGEKCTEVSVDADGKVLSVGGNDTAIPEGGFVLSAGGGAKANVLKKLAVGDLLWLDAEKETVTMVPAGYNPFSVTELAFQRINMLRVQDSIVLFNTGETTGTNDWGYEVVVNAEGYVIGLGGNDNAIPAGGFVLSGHGKGKTALEAAAKLGDKAEADLAAKTVSFRRDAEGQTEQLRVRAETFRADAEKKTESGRLLDAEAVGSTYGKMVSVYEQAKEALNDDTLLRFVVMQNAFEELASEAELLLTEYRPVEGRCVWIRPALTANREKVFKEVKSIYDAGFNQVYVELLFDNTTIMPVPEGSFYTQNPSLNGADLLALYIEACHSYRLEIHGWYSVMRVGYKGSANTKYSVAMKKPEWKNISKNGVDFVKNEFGDAYFLNPALPEVREYLLSFCRYLAEHYALDGLHLDYIRYPNNGDGEDFGYDETTCEAFKAQYGTDPHDITAGSALYKTFSQFRADYVTQFVRALSEMLAEVRPDLYLSAAVAPNYANTLTAMCQDPGTWLKEGLLDMVLPMAYGTDDLVKTCITNTLSLTEKGSLAFYGLSDQGEEVLKSQIRVTREHDTDGFGFFSWNSYAGNYDSVSGGILAEKALSPLWDGKASVAALLRLAVKRLDSFGAESEALQSLRTNTAELAEKLESSSLSGQSAALTALFAQAREALPALTAARSETVGNDYRFAERILLRNRDDARAAYLRAHPLPESLIEEKEPDDESGEQSAQEGASGEESEKGQALNPVEKVAQIISVIVIASGVLLLPVYFILNARKKKIAREYRENHENRENGSGDPNGDPSGDPNGDPNGN